MSMAEEEQGEKNHSPGGAGRGGRALENARYRCGDSVDGLLPFQGNKERREEGRGRKKKRHVGAADELRTHLGPHRTSSTTRGTAA